MNEDSLLVRYNPAALAQRSSGSTMGPIINPNNTEYPREDVLMVNKVERLEVVPLVHSYIAVRVAPIGTGNESVSCVVGKGP